MGLSFILCNIYQDYQLNLDMFRVRLTSRGITVVWYRSHNFCSPPVDEVGFRGYLLRYISLSSILSHPLRVSIQLVCTLSYSNLYIYSTSSFVLLACQLLRRNNHFLTAKRDSVRSDGPLFLILILEDATSNYAAIQHV